MTTDEFDLLRTFRAAVPFPDAEAAARVRGLAALDGGLHLRNRHNGAPRIAGSAARRGCRGFAVAAAALVGLIIAVVAAAYALGHPVIEFGKAPHASSRTVVNFFGRMTIGVPHGIPVLPNQARRITVVRVDGRDHALLIAPIKHGGYCYAWSNSANGCQLPGQPRYLSVIGLSTSAAANEPLSTIGGSFPQARTARINLTFADGQTTEISFVWVTDPINSGFFLFGVPKAHQRLGHQPVRILLFDASGALITSQPVMGIAPRIRVLPYKLVQHRLAGYPPLSVPAPAEWAKRRQLFDWRADTDTHTHIGLWIAPARGGGTCYWSNIHSGCSGGQTSLPLWPKIRRGNGYVSLCCTISDHATRLDLFFQDGDHVTITPKHGYLIWPIPRRHYPPGHRLDKLIIYDAHGSRIDSLNVPTYVRALYPCSKPKNYGYGLVMCP